MADVVVFLHLKMGRILDMKILKHHQQIQK